MYKCENKDCSEYGIEKNPGGRIIYANSKSFYTGSSCKMCGKQMTEIITPPAKILNIVNASDGRNL
jgi:ribosomal protein L34E